MNMIKCNYYRAWIGECGQLALADSNPPRCINHSGIVCCVCGEPSDRECDHSGQFVCGAPLCCNCEGWIDQNKPSGVWGTMNHYHRRKEQKTVEAATPTPEPVEVKTNDTPFDWLLGQYLKRGADNIAGTIVHQDDKFLNGTLMDAGFNFSSTAVKVIKEHLAGLGFKVRRVFFYTAFDTDLERKSTSMKTESRLYVVRNEDGTHNALFFTGCSITESK